MKISTVQTAMDGCLNGKRKGHKVFHAFFGFNLIRIKRKNFPQTTPHINYVRGKNNGSERKISSLFFSIDIGGEI